MDVIAQVSIPYYTGIPEDVSTNVWNFHQPTGSIDPAEIGAFMSAMYTPLVTWAHPLLNFTAASGKFYDRADPLPRTPFFEATFDLGEDNLPNEGLPTEVAVCLSVHGVFESGQPKARRRGRVYLGPLGVGTLNDAGGGKTAVEPTFLTDMLDAYEAAWAGLTTAGLSHAVWSSADNEAYPVVEAWMDNAFDTQRRRGIIATSRETRTGPF